MTLDFLFLSLKVQIKTHHKDLHSLFSLFSFKSSSTNQNTLQVFTLSFFPMSNKFVIFNHK